MSGLEVAGIVLSVLPLFHVTAKAYSKNASVLQKAALRSTRDDSLRGFYKEFSWYTVVLKHQIKDIVMELPHLSEERKKEVIDGMDVENWDKAVDISQALREYFASEDDHQAFQDVMGNIMKLFALLVEDETVHISKSEKDQSKMYRKLRKFQEDEDAGRTSSTFRERVKFFKREKDRITCLKNLERWSDRM